MRLITKDIYPIHEKLEIGLLLAMIGGFLDAYTYVCFDGVFANAQTGNMVLLGISLIHYDWSDFFNYLIPILFFSMGILITEYFASHLIRAFFIVTLGIELFLLSFIGVFPELLPSYITIALISMICSIQLASFKKICGMTYSSTMCTGNLRTSMEALYGYFHQKDRALLYRSLHYGAIILFFCVGAVIGALSSAHFGKRAIFICCGFLLLLSCLILLDFMRYHHEKE